jgi:hypothetical protein
MGETTFYSVRIDKPGAWFTGQDIEQDPFPAEVPEPAMKWNSHRLEIEISAKSLSGSIERRYDDLTVIRSYVRPKT